MKKHENTNGNYDISLFVENELGQIDESKLPQILSKRLELLEQTNIAYNDAKKREDEARIKVNNALMNAEELIVGAKNAGKNGPEEHSFLKFKWTTKSDEIAAIKKNLEDLVKCGINSAEAQKELVDVQSAITDSQTALLKVQETQMAYQKQIADATKFLYGLSAYNIGANQSVLINLEAILTGASKEKLGEMAKQQMLLAMDQLKNQESIYLKIKKNKELIDSLDLELVENNKKIESLQYNDKKQDKLIENLQKQDEEQDILIEDLRKQDEEQDNLIEDLRKQDEEQDNLIEDLRKQDEEQDSLIEDLRKQDEEQDSLIEDLQKQDEEQDSLIEGLRKQDEEQDNLIEDLRKQDEEQDSLIEDLRKQDEEQDSLIEDLQKQGEEQDSLIEDLRKQDEEQDSLIEDLCKQDEEHDNLIEDLRKQDEEQDRLIENLQKQDEEQDALIENLQNKYNEINEIFLQLNDNVEINSKTNKESFIGIEEKINNLEYTTRRKGWKITISIIAIVSLMLNTLQILGVI